MHADSDFHRSRRPDHAPDTPEQPRAKTPDHVNPYASPDSECRSPALQGSYLDHYQTWLLLGILGIGFGPAGLIQNVTFPYGIGLVIYGGLSVIGVVSLAAWLLLNFLSRR